MLKFLQGHQRGHDAFKDKKIFMGGLPNSVDEAFLKNFFAKYGRVSVSKFFQI